MNSDKLISDIDTEHLMDITNRLSVSESNRKVKTMDFLLNSLEIESRQIENADLILCNYIYATIIVRKHLY